MVQDGFPLLQLVQAPLLLIHKKVKWHKSKYKKEHDFVKGLVSETVVIADLRISHVGGIGKNTQDKANKY